MAWWKAEMRAAVVGCDSSGVAQSEPLARTMATE